LDMAGEVKRELAEAEGRGIGQNLVLPSPFQWPFSLPGQLSTDQVRDG
jgi:hypothetical protein